MFIGFSYTISNEILGSSVGKANTSSNSSSNSQIMNFSNTLNSSYIVLIAA